MASKESANTIWKCGECGKPWMGKDPKEAGQCCAGAVMRKMTTQKLRGLVSLMGYSFDAKGSNDNNYAQTLSVLMVFDAKDLESSAEVFQKKVDRLTSKDSLFLRPCPLKPRHGFIESRPFDPKSTTLAKDIRKLLKETIDEHPDNELAVMEQIDASYNAIITPTMIAVGNGHDGATGGKATVTMPLVRQEPLYVDAFNAAGVDLSKDDPYIEVVYDRKRSDKPVLTQLRSGLKDNLKLGNWIPKATLVKQIIKGSTDIELLEWEKQINQVKGLAGVIVWHPGGSPVDHISLHARYAGIPIVFEAAPPALMTWLEPTTKQEPLSIDGFFDGVAAAFSDRWAPKPTWARMLTLALTAHHNTPALEGKFGGQVLGFAAGALIRLGYMALRGEARHAQTSDYGKARSDVYKDVVKNSLPKVRAELVSLINIHRYGRFSSSSFGGLKWAQCGQTVLNLVNAITATAKTSSQAELMNALAAMNVLVNQAHNGGWWLNKFHSETTFDYVQCFHPPVLAEAALALTEFQQELLKSSESGARIRKLLTRARPLQLRAPIIKDMDVSINGSSINVTPKYRGRAFYSKSLQLSVGEIMKQVKKSIKPDRSGSGLAFTMEKLSLDGFTIKHDDDLVPQEFKPRQKRPVLQMHYTKGNVPTLGSKSSSSSSYSSGSNYSSVDISSIIPPEKLAEYAKIFQEYQNNLSK